MDMRTPGKGYEEFYDKLLEEGVHFVRGRVGKSRDWAMTPEEEGKLVLRVEDTLADLSGAFPSIVCPGHRLGAAGRRAGRAAHVQLTAVQKGSSRTASEACPVNTSPWHLPRRRLQVRAIFRTVARPGPVPGIGAIDRGYIEQEPNTLTFEEESSGCKSASALPVHGHTLTRRSPSRRL